MTAECCRLLNVVFRLEIPVAPGTDHEVRKVWLYHVEGHARTSVSEHLKDIDKSVAELKL